MTTLTSSTDFISHADLRARGWSPGHIKNNLRDVRVHDGSEDPNRSPYSYPLAEVERIEQENENLAADVSAVTAEQQKKAAAEALLIPRDPNYTNEGAWTREMLKDIGWTDTLIKRHLGAPDFIRTTRNDRDLYMWARDRVLSGPEQVPELAKSLAAEGKRRQRKAEREAANLEADTLATTTRNVIGEPFELHRIASRGERLVYSAGSIMHIHDGIRYPGNPNLTESLRGKRFLVLTNSSVRREMDLDFDHAWNRIVEIEPTAEELASDADDKARRQRRIEGGL